MTIPATAATESSDESAWSFPAPWSSLVVNDVAVFASVLESDVGCAEAMVTLAVSGRLSIDVFTSAGSD
jgi:hypothetical protein